MSTAEGSFSLQKHAILQKHLDSIRYFKVQQTTLYKKWKSFRDFVYLSLDWFHSNDWNKNTKKKFGKNRKRKGGAKTFR